MSVATNLPAGRYSFVIEAVPTADASFRLGEAFVTTFEIAGDEQYDGTSPTTDAPPDEPTPGTTPDGPGAPGASVTEGDDDGGREGSSTSPPSASVGESSTTPGSSSGNGTGSDGSDSNDGTTPNTTGGADPGDAAPGNTTEATPSTTTGRTAPSDGDGNSAESNNTDSTKTDSTNTVPDDSAPGNTVPETPAPVPSGIGPGAAKEGAWESISVSPQAGYVDEVTTVMIRGNFPLATYVWFGDQPGQVVHQNQSSITVRTPLRAEPGVVDVTLQKSGSGVVLTIPDAYAFVSYDETLPDGAISPDPSDGTSNPDGTSGDTGDSDFGNDSSGEGDPGTDDGNADGDVDPDESGATSDRRARMTVGSAVDLPSGLKGASVTPNVASGVVVCSTDPCVAIRR